MTDYNNYWWNNWWDNPYNENQLDKTTLDILYSDQNDDEDEVEE